MSESPTLEVLLEQEARMDRLEDGLDAITFAFLVLARCLDASGTLPLDTLARGLQGCAQDPSLRAEELRDVRGQLDALGVSVLQLRQPR